MRNTVCERVYVSNLNMLVHRLQLYGTFGGLLLFGGGTAQEVERLPWVMGLFGGLPLFGGCTAQ